MHAHLYIASLWVSGTTIFMQYVESNVYAQAFQQPQPQPQSQPTAWRFLGTVTWKRWDEKMVSWSENVEIQPITHRIHVWFTLITQIICTIHDLHGLGWWGSYLLVNHVFFGWWLFHVWILGDFSAFLFGMMVSTMMFLKVVGDHIYLHLQPKV